MNAYELADELLRDNTQLTVTSAYMLRQQADRIAKLEQNLSAYIVELELHKAMIQDLEKQKILTVTAMWWPHGPAQPERPCVQRVPALGWPDPAGADRPAHLAEQRAFVVRHGCPGQARAWQKRAGTCPPFFVTRFSFATKIQLQLQIARLIIPCPKQRSCSVGCSGFLLQRIFPGRSCSRWWPALVLCMSAKAVRISCLSIPEGCVFPCHAHIHQAFWSSIRSGLPNRL